MKNSIKKTIFLSRHGESQYNLEGKLGGDSSLSENGIIYSKKLYNYFKLNNNENIKVITSNLKRTKETATFFNNKYINENLNEINAGIYEHFTYDQVKKDNINEFNKRKKDKFNYRYPDGESYKDLEDRVLKIFIEITNNNDNVFILAHNAVLRVIFGYLYKFDKAKIPYLDIPLHNLYRIDIYNDDSVTKTVISLN